MKIKKNDLVKVIAGDHKGKAAKVISIQPVEQTVKLEGINQITRHLKRSQLHPQGGTRELHRGIHISNVAPIVDKDKTARIGFELKKDGTKVRVARNHGNKEIK